MSPFFAELLGSMILIILGGGVVAGVVLEKSKSYQGGWIVITAGWAMAVTLAIYTVGKISGAHINPAVTLALASVGKFPWSKVVPYILAQIIGAFIGAIIVFFHYLAHWKVTKDREVKLAVFATTPAIRSPLANLLSEIIGTFVLVMGILGIGSNDFVSGINPLIIGLLILAIGLSLGGTTGYAINPARDFGPRLAFFLMPIPGKGDAGWSYSWIPIVGPILGGVYGAQFFTYISKPQESDGLLFWALTLVVFSLFILALVKELRKDRKKHPLCELEDGLKLKE